MHFSCKLISFLIVMIQSVLYRIYSLFLILPVTALGQQVILGSNHNNWQQFAPKTTQKVKHNVWLLGNLGTQYPYHSSPTLSMMAYEIERASSNHTIVLLGNQINPQDIPSPQKKDDKAFETYQQHLSLLKDIKASIYMVPGQYEWINAAKGERNAIRQLEDFTETFLDQGDVWRPSKGCADPEVVELSKDITLIMLDSQWFLENESSFTDVKGCSVDSKTELKEELAEIFDEYDDTDILVAFHHPIKSSGPSAGYNSWKDHLLPLPGIGTLTTAFDQIGLSPQNMNHPVHKAFCELLMDLTIQTGYLIFAYSHDHGLQYFKEDPGFSLTGVIKSKRHFVGSGSAVSGGYLRKNSPLDAGYRGEGLVKLVYYDNGEIWLEMWRPASEPPKGELIFRYQIKDKSYTKGDPQAIPLDEPDSVIAVADSFYVANRIKRKWLGNYYRDAWTTPVKLPVLDISQKYGGLEVVKKGGGIQTKSLRLKDSLENEYVLRSVMKDITLLVPGQARNTVIEDFAQDALAMAHPYGALSIPPLAEAADVFHTNPQYYYVPKQPMLGDFNEIFGNQIYLFEQRPEEPKEGKTELHFGNTEEITSTKDLMRERKEKGDKIIDQRDVLNARLFDMWVGDWDRHQDQWRWAEFDSGRLEYYKPIPRDRDQVFISVDGLIPWLITREWGARMFQDFDYEVRDILGLNYNARFFDRYFLNEMDRQNWLEQARILQQKLPDEVINQAFKRWPKPIYDLNASEIMDKLNVRRDKLPDFALRYYKHMARSVDITTTDKKEKFSIQRLNDRLTKVTIYALDEDGKIDFERYNRTFDKKDTREVRLYGFKGDDIFEISGNVRTGTLIRIIGGPGKDTVLDQSSTSYGKRIRIYDTNTGNHFQTGHSAKIFTSKEEDINDYDYKSHKLNSYLPLIYPGYNLDDGATLGAGINFTYHGFRKDPYKSKHSLSTNIAFATGSFQLGYQGDYIDVFGKWDFFLNTEGSAPRFVTNFFGLGNDTEYTSAFDDDFDINRVRYSRILLEPALKQTYNQQMHRILIGPRYEYTDVERTEGRFVDRESSGLDDDDFEPKHYAGIKLNYLLDTRDNQLFPRRGYVWEIDQSFNVNMEDTDMSYYHLSTSVSIYHRTKIIIPFILATSVGYATNIGDYEFFQANTLGRRSNLRGFRGERFAGDDAFYHNTEIRLPVFKAQNYYLPFELGLTGFFDHGRVWLKKESSDRWHYGYGGGIIISPYTSTAITLTYSTSEEFNTIVVRFGFLF